MPTKKRSPIEAAHQESAQAGAGGTAAFEASPQAQSREEQVRRAAYFAAERRGFAPGYEMEDWVQAEQEVDTASGSSEGAEQI